MNFHYEFDIKKLAAPVSHHDATLLIGSCFTEHIGDHLRNNKFPILQNPHGIVFNPVSISKALTACINQYQYSEADLFYHNECWHSWDHHSSFSHPDKETCLHKINQSCSDAHHFLKKAGYVLITLGAAFIYELVETGQPVANCHKFPQAAFRKRLMTVEEILSALDNLHHRLQHFNPGIQTIFTISPVRHLRDGVVENNRSKAALIQCVHHLTDKFDKVYYFPAYELVIDDLRDYRFYAEDLVHPNYQATNYVWEKFIAACIHPSSRELMEAIQKITAAMQHKVFHPDSEAHRRFLRAQLEKVKNLAAAHPHLNWERELAYFEE
jgi:GSCFA family